MLGAFLTMRSFIKTYLLISLLLVSGQILGKETDKFLELDRDGIKVYLYGVNSPNIALFKAVTHIESSMDSILAVMFDNKNCVEWIHGCKNSFVLKDVGFNERYHYQSIYVPFPFKNREFIFHSVLKQDIVNKTVTITMFTVPDYCKNRQSEQCQKINQSNLVRVNHSVGTYKLESTNNGTKITWIQYTDPAGNLPNWLVNKFVKDTPYWTFKKLAEKVKEDKYKYAKLIYDSKGNAVALNSPTQKRIESSKMFNGFTVSPN